MSAVRSKAKLERSVGCTYTIVPIGVQVSIYAIYTPWCVYEVVYEIAVLQLLILKASGIKYQNIFSIFHGLANKDKLSTDRI